jgi:hypothetical protein
MTEFRDAVKSKEHVLRYWPHGKPIPPGWIMVDDFRDIHHGHHAVLIEKIDPEASDGEGT